MLMSIVLGFMLISTAFCSIQLMFTRFQLDFNGILLYTPVMFGSHETYSPPQPNMKYGSEYIILGRTTFNCAERIELLKGGCVGDHVGNY